MFWDIQDKPFQMFSFGHWLAFFVLAGGVIALYILKEKGFKGFSKTAETSAALFLLLLEAFFHYWQWQHGIWSLAHSLPLELCSISLLLSILLLLTGSKAIFELVFFAGIAGALQAVLTPVLFSDFPRFRYFHFFLTHSGIIWTVLYFAWIKGYVPTLLSAGKSLLFLNLLLPAILLVNFIFGSNYMFLRGKPASKSILDLLGPYPWYILSLEFAAAAMFFLLWGLFRGERGLSRQKGRNSDRAS